MSRITSLAIAGLTATALTAGSITDAAAAPLPALSSNQVAGTSSTVDHVWYRGYGGYYGPGYGYGYRRRNVAGAIAAGAALGVIGGAIAASAAPRYGYYGYPAYGYSYPAYGYPAYGYGYGYPYGW